MRDMILGSRVAFYVQASIEALRTSPHITQMPLFSTLKCAEKGNAMADLSNTIWPKFDK